MEKINKNNSILNDEYWLKKAINDGRLDLLPVYKPVANLSVGEFIELGYTLQNQPKVTKANSILYNRMLVGFYYDNGWNIPRNRIEGMSLNEQLEIEIEKNQANPPEFYKHLRYYKNGKK